MNPVKNRKKTTRKLPIEYCHMCPHVDVDEDEGITTHIHCTHPDNPTPKEITLHDYNEGIIPVWCKLPLEK